MAQDTFRFLIVMLIAVVSNITMASTMEETVVVADRVDTSADSLAVSVNVIDREQINILGSATLPQLLKTQVGISTTQNGGIGAVTGIRIRGQDAFRTRLLVDGIDVSDPSSPQISPRIEHILSDSLERIEVLRGTQGLLWGADAGGVIALTSRRGTDKPSLNVRSERGGYGFETESLAVSTGATSMGAITAVLNQAKTDGLNSRLSDTELLDRDGYTNDSVHVTYMTPEWRGWSATVTKRDVDASSDYDGCGRFDDSFNFVSSDNCSDGYENENQGVVVAHSGTEHQTQIRWSESDSYRSYYTDDLFQFELTGVNKQMSVLHNRTVREGMRLTLGIDSDEQSYDDGFGTARSRGNDAAFINLQQSLERGTVSLAVRADDNDDFGRHTSWRLTALRETRFDGITLKAAYGTGFRAPSPYEVGSNLSPFALAEAQETSLTEEQSAGWEVGVRGTQNAVRWDLTYFQQRVSDAIVYSYVPSLFAGGYLQVEGTSKFNGIEATAAWQLSPSFMLDAFISQLSAEDTTGIDLPYRPDLTAQLSASYTGTQSRWLVLARHTGDRSDGFGTQLASYSVMDASYTRDIGKSVSVSLRAENLMDKGYTDIVGYRSPGRTLYAGISLSL